MLTRSDLGRVFLRFGVLVSNAVLFGAAARRFDPRDMGIWSLASAMTSIVVSFDLGVANFTRNQVVLDAERARAFFWAGVRFTLVLAAVYLCVVWAFYILMPPGAARLGGLQAALPYLLAPILLLALRLPTGVATNSFFSFNEANLYNTFEFATAALAALTALVLLATGVSLGYVLVGFYAVGTLVGWWGFATFVRKRQWLNGAGQRVALIEVAKGAWPFGALQIVTLGLSNLPAFLIGSLVGLEDVTSVRAVVIMSQAVLALHLAHAMPLWTRFSRMHTAGAAETVELQQRLLKEAALLGAVFVVVAVVAPFLINLWVGRPVSSAPLCIAFSVWGWSCGVCNLYSLVLNGRGRPLRTAAAVVPGAALAALLAEVLGKIWGSVGVGIAFAIGASLSAVLMVRFSSAQMRSISSRVA